MDIMALGLLVTLMVGFHLPVPLNVLFDIGLPLQLALVSAVILLFSFFKKTVSFQRLLQGVALGILLLNLHTEHFYQYDFIQGQNNQYIVNGEVINDQFPLVCDQQIFCQHKLLIKPSYVNDKPIRAQLFSPLIFVKAEKQALLLSKGDQVHFIAKLNRPLGYENQFGFNLAKWSFANRVAAKGKVLGKIRVINKGAKISQVFLNKLIVHVSQYENNAYFYPLLLAESSTLSHEQKEQLQQYGLSHLFAISGLHIGILFVVLNIFTRLFFSGFRQTKPLLIIHLVSILSVWAYVYLIDFPIPSTRAAILLSVWLGLMHSNWHARKSWIFAVMSISTLIVQPTGVLDAGWWLSISAVAGIFIFNHLLKPRHNTESVFLGDSIKLALIFQIYIGIWLLPLSLYWFSGVSIAGFWLNIVLVPVFCFMVIPGLFLASFFMLLNLNWLSTVLFSLVDEVLTWCLKGAEYLSREISWLSLPEPIYATILAVIVTLMLIRVIDIKTKLAIGLFVISVLSTHKLVQNKSSSVLKVMVLDVGQGTSILLFRNGKGILYDLGPVFMSGFSATEAVVSPNIRGLGIRQLDRIIVSHQDSDHYGDIQALNSLLPEHRGSKCPSKISVWQNTKLVPLWPDKGIELANKRSDNDLSCVLKVVDLASSKSLLLTGDIGKDVEMELVKKHRLGVINLQAEILFSAHHGSRFSSSYPFLKKVRAEHVIHTAGVFNHFGFPTTQVIKRIKHFAVTQHSTSNLGQLVITFSTKDRQIKVQSLLNWFSPYWKKQNPFSFQVEIR